MNLFTEKIKIKNSVTQGYAVVYHKRELKDKIRLHDKTSENIIWLKTSKGVVSGTKKELHSRKSAQTGRFCTFWWKRNESRGLRKWRSRCHRTTGSPKIKRNIPIKILHKEPLRESNPVYGKAVSLVGRRHQRR